jgi:Flp pilus assembly protein TadG
MALRLWHDRRGNAALGWMAALLLILCVGAIYDVYAAYHYRTWGYQVAGEAARYAVLQGSGLDYASGDPGLAADVATKSAEDFLKSRLAEQGITSYTFQTHVIVDSHGGTVPGFPPVANASLDGRPMALAGPGMGVYLEFSFPTAWLNLVGRNSYRLHVFSAAELAAVEAQP